MKLTKTLTYGLMHLTVAISVTYLLTGSLIAALSVGLVEPLVQTLFYSVHERLWAKLEAGEGALPNLTPSPQP